MYIYITLYTSGGLETTCICTKSVDFLHLWVKEKMMVRVFSSSSCSSVSTDLIYVGAIYACGDGFTSEAESC